MMDGWMDGWNDGMMDGLLGWICIDLRSLFDVFSYSPVLFYVVSTTLEPGVKQWIVSIAYEICFLIQVDV
ncbi:hypothetical protein BDW42DRAFT_169775 [Aspergillus taichungensis]|uniref:Uncharacterized protein n=1 Tax=Aspergillus taichungensis TaxID=482145 RepID=A0A2J5HUF4_9EURO|nr:hypothetical protein BDW42DRAFT_169775 [Aspergillus taichungensis]